MRDHPDTGLLLASARRALLEQVVPQLEGEARGIALMVARSLSVVAARLETDARAFTALDSGIEVGELAALAELLDMKPDEARRSMGGTQEAVAQLSRRLVEEIRAGRFDPPDPRHEALRSFLANVTRAKVAENNPKALEHIGRDEGDKP